MKTTCGLRHAPLPDVFASWHSTTFRAGLLPLFVAPLPVWVGLKVSFFYLTWICKTAQGKAGNVCSISFSQRCLIVYLECQIMVLLLLLRAKGIPPFPENLADRPIVLVRVPLVYQCSMTLTEDHKSIHWSSDVVLLPLKACKQYLRMWNHISIEQGCLMLLKKHWHANLPRTVFIAIFGQCTEGLSASFYWRCGEGLLWYNSREEAERTVFTFVVFIRHLLLGPYGGMSLSTTFIYRRRVKDVYKETIRNWKWSGKYGRL